MKKATLEEMHELAKIHGGRCLSKKYINTKTHLDWQCNEGHIWSAIPLNIKRGSWCPKCAIKLNARRKIKLSIEDMQNLAKERGGECLSKKYLGLQKKLTWQCSDGHIWKATPGKIRFGRWCPECSVGLGERICRTFFEQVFNRRFPKSKPVWLVNKDGNQMELDGYCEKLKLAFEHQGRQHYNHVEFFHSENEFKKRQKDDEEKIKLCKEHNIVLIQVPAIPDKLKLNEIKSFIIKKSPQLGIRCTPQNVEVDLKRAYTLDNGIKLEILQNTARKRGGECLSDVYLGSTINHLFQCGIKHKWEATPYNINKGTWCPYCAGNVKLDIKEMQKIASDRKGKLLSEGYVNNSSKLRWRCKNGHEWEASPANVKRGSWCPECKKVKKLTIEDMHLLAKNRGGRCLSKTYVNVRTKLTWICSEGHVWQARPNGIQQGQWCPQCGGSKKFIIEDMQEIARRRNGMCLSKEYINARTHLKWKCEKGHIWEATPEKIKRGQWCHTCGRIKKYGRE